MSKPKLIGHDGSCRIAVKISTTNFFLLPAVGILRYPEYVRKQGIFAYRIGFSWLNAQASIGLGRRLR